MSLTPKDGVSRSFVRTNTPVGYPWMNLKLEALFNRKNNEIDNGLAGET